MKEMPREIRKSILKMMYNSKSSHIGSCFSIVEILHALYFDILNIAPQNPGMPERDIFILSKGHASAALYATLAHRGFFPLDYLERYYVDNGLLPGHLDMSVVPGIECSAGSLGHGLSIGLGMAIARLRRKESGRVFVLLGDGECNEGSVWEAIMLAATLKIGNLIAIVDFNHLQGMGSDVIEQGNIAERFKVFGWKATEVDGHDSDALVSVFSDERLGGPAAIIARTVKGKGVSFMENRLEWHYKSPNDGQFTIALSELDGAQ